MPSSVTVDSSTRESLYLSQDTPPSDVTVNLSLEEAQIDVEECRLPVEDKDSLTADTSSKNAPQIEAAAHTPVPRPSTSLGPFTQSLEIELTPESSASAPKRTAPVAAGTIGPQDEPIHTQTLLACSSEPLTLPIGTTVAPSNSKERTVVVNTPDDGHAQTKAVHPPALPPCLPLGSSTPPNMSELHLANSLSTPEKLSPVPEFTRPQAEAIHTPSHLGGSPSGRLTPPIGSDPDPASVVPTRNRTTVTPDGTVPRVEAVHPLNAPLEPSAPAGNAPTLNHASFHSDTTPRSEIDRPTVQSVRCPVHPIPPTGSKPTLTTGMPAPVGIPLFSEHVRSPVELVRRPPLVEPPPVRPAEPAFPIGKMPAATENRPALHVSPPAERVRPQIEAVRSAIQNTRAPLKPQVPSIAVGSVPHLSMPPPPSERARTQVEAPHPPVRPAYAPLDSRAPSVSNQSAPLNNVSVSDVEARISSRSRIKSHPRRMVAPIGPRRSTALPMNPQLTLQPSGQPMARPGEHSGAHLAQVSVATSVSPAASNNALRMSSTIAQDPMGQSRRSTVLTGQMTPHLTSVSPTTRLVEKPVPGSASNRSSSAPITRHYDRAAGALSHSSQAKSSRLTVIPEGQGTPKSYPMVRPATPSKALTAAATAEKANTNIAISPQSLQNSVPRTSSIVDIRHSASQPRKSVVLPDQISQQGVRSSYQPVMGLQSIIPSPASKSSNVSDPVAKTHLGKTAEVRSYNSRSDASGVAVKTETRGGSNGYSVAPRVLPTLPAGGTATISASPASNSTSRISSRIKTKDLLNRHKQQNASVARSPSIAETTSLSRTPMSGLSQTAPLAGKLSANRIDSGIELWDYDPHGAIPDRRKGFDTANGHSNPPRDRGHSFTLPTNYPAGASNLNNEDGTSASLRLKKSRASIRGSPTPVVSLAHSDKPTRMSTPPPPEQVQTPLLRATRSSAGSPSSTTPGRREPFINRKPQPMSQSTSTVQSGFSTPPRSSTPSSVSRSASITTSSQTTIATPATSFTIPSRGPSPAMEPMHKSWFRRNVIEPVKSKLGYGS